MANAWNELTWSIGNYGEQNNHTEVVGSVSASSSVGNFEIETQQILSIEGFSLSANLGNPEIDLLNNGWGASTWGFSTWGQTGDVILGTNLASTAIGSVTTRAGATAFPDSILLQTVNESPFIKIDNEAIVTGVQSQFTVGDASPAADANTGFFGSVTAQTLNGVVAVNGEIQIGWGGDTWGENLWGELSGAFANVEGVTANTNINSVDVEADANVDVTGIQLQTTNQGVVAGTSALIEQEGLGIQIVTGNEEINFTYLLTGVDISTAAGQSTIDPTFLIGSGWGRDTFGNLGWGVNYSVIGGGVNGLQADIVTGNENAFTDFVQVIDTSFGLNTAINSVDIQADGNASVNVEEEGLQLNLGTVDLTGTAEVNVQSLSLSTDIGQAEGFLLLEVPVTGVSVNIFAGNEDTAANATVFLDGLSANFEIGNAVTGIGVPITGVSAQLNLGQVSVSGEAVVVIPTGIGLTVNTISPNIIAWAEVDTGTPVNWTPVDLAA